jgi:hypothetical protein
MRGLDVRSSNNVMKSNGENDPLIGNRKRVDRCGRRERKIQSSKYPLVSPPIAYESSLNPLLNQSPGLNL